MSIGLINQYAMVIINYNHLSLALAPLSAPTAPPAVFLPPPHCRSPPFSCCSPFPVPRFLTPSLDFPAVRVTLDQDTAHPALTLSADRLNVRLGDTQQDLPDNPERFNERPCVLGSQGFTKGAVYWEVEVGNEVFWVVGVARESVRRKGWVSASRKEGIWAIDWSRRMPPVPPSPQSTPPQKSRRIRVCLNYEGRQVTFFNADNEALILTVTGANFARERIRPFFGTKSQLRLCPCPEPEGQAGDPHQ